jgi:HEPN domain-containing protein
MKIHEIAEWFLIADEDAVSAEILNKENNLGNSYYHCSQAVEKYLKCYLVANDIKINKDHNISETLMRCINIDKSFTELLSECNKMTLSIKNLRYPGRIIPTKENIQNAFYLIEKIKKLKPIQELYNNIIGKYGDNWKDVLYKNVANI